MYVYITVFVTEAKLILCFCKFKPQDTLTLLSSVYTGQTNYIYRLLDECLDEKLRENYIYANVSRVVSPVRRNLC